MSGIEDLIQASLDQDYNKASEVFGDVMTIKMDDALEQEKVALSQQVYNGEEPNEFDEEDLEDVDFDDTEEDEELEDDEEELDFGDEVEN